MFKMELKKQEGVYKKHKNNYIYGFIPYESIGPIKLIVLNQPAYIVPIGCKKQVLIM